MFPSLHKIGITSLVALSLAVSNTHAGDGLVPNTGAPDSAHPNVRYEQKLGEKVPLDLTFTDENGNEVTLGQCIDGKPTILIVAYYICPMLCGEVLNGVLDATRKMKMTIGKEFNVVAVSFDPRDKPGLALAKKRHFVNEYGRKEADYGWKFLTGQKPNIDRLTEAVGFHYEYDPMIKQFNHPSGIIILTPDGTISRYLPGIDYLDHGDLMGQNVQDPTRTLRLSLVEAGNGQIGDFSDRVFLSCYLYSPHSGKYSLSVMWIVRAGGLLTLLIIAGVYARLHWKLPGARLLVVGILAYVSLLPVIMFTSFSVFSVDTIPKWALRASIVPIGLLFFVVGRWIWKSAKRAKVTAESRKELEASVEA